MSIAATLVQELRSGEVTIESGRERAQALIVAFDEVVGGPSVTPALAVLHARIQELPEEALAEHHE